MRPPIHLLILGLALAVLTGCSREAAQRRGEAVPVPEWIPVVRELRARGIKDPVVLVGVFATYDLRAASQPMVIGRIPKALATVAAATGENVADLRTRFLARIATEPLAREFLAQQQALAPKLTGLPGVPETPRWDGFDSKQMAVFARQWATAEGIPLPTTSRVSAEWLPLLRRLRTTSDDPDVHQFVILGVRLHLKTGAVVEPLDEDARYLTVAQAFDLDPVKYRKDFHSRMMWVTSKGPNPVALAKDARAILATFPEVDRLEDVPYSPPPPEVKANREGDELIDPPWVAFPEPPSSLRWRMGAGEDYLDRWLPFWRGLPEATRREYMARHPPPPVWQDWLSED